MRGLIDIGSDEDAIVTRYHIGESSFRLGEAHALSTWMVPNTSYRERGIVTFAERDARRAARIAVEIDATKIAAE